VFAWEPS
jgi:ribonuclease HI